MIERETFFETPISSESKGFIHVLQKLGGLEVPKKRREELVLRLNKAPTYVDLYTLRETLEQNVEYGVVFSSENWYLIKGQESCIESIALDSLSSNSIFLHTHPYSEDEGPEDFSLPSITDAINAIVGESQVIRGVISGLGLTLHDYRDTNKNLQRPDPQSWREHLDSIVSDSMRDEQYIEIKDEKERHRLFLEKRLEQNILQLSWGEEVREYWETITNVY